MAAIPTGFSCCFSTLVLEGDNAASSHLSVPARPLFSISLCKGFCVFLETGGSHKLHNCPRAQAFPAPCLDQGAPSLLQPGLNTCRAGTGTAVAQVPEPEGWIPSRTSTAVRWI